MKTPTAVVMNMFYTGIGIARSLGRRGVPVIGLSSESGIAGNFTRYARIVSAPDSRRQPEALRDQLLRMGKECGEKSVIFPTRDDDVVFLDRFREELQPYYSPVIPKGPAVHACLNKWETYLCAQRAEVATPRCCLVCKSPDRRRRENA